MARMIPETFPAIPNDASPQIRSGLETERWIYEFLRDAPDTDGWVVCYSVPVTPQFGSQREVDFLVIVPNKAVVCVEVKSGAFDVIDGQWHERTSSGLVPREAADQQSYRAFSGVKYELETEFGVTSPEARIPAAYTVILTSSRWPDEYNPPKCSVIDFDTQLTMFADRGKIATEICKIATNIAEQTAGPRLTDRRATRILAYFNRATVRAESPGFPGTTPAEGGDPYSKIMNRQVRLTEEQYRALESTENAPRCLFTGPPGTGKTMLALELARRRTEAGDRVLSYALTGYWRTGYAGRTSAMFKPANRICL